MDRLNEYSARMPVLAAGSRSGVRHAFAAPELIRPDQPNPFSVIAPWNGVIVEVYVRNSDPSQRGDSRSFVQSDDFPRQLLLQGYAVRINDEQGTSGGKIESDDPRKNRRIFQGILAR